ncbi:DUF4920 domain-containing protein [Chitinophaga sp. Cy-1792]|uniref:DUF4920 domain-containing protein n=1 Tax=Chitinophaga sp. Cy-1792 TaxID=2608339 RepID=UPI001421C867|nr:DUF4920 domain-containing protein [Chitinophaga sp. Cy-1792]NIG56379.1 DUF4920 domain-containing protein [Chitinophaga sp. Cy-1792]
MLKSMISLLALLLVVTLAVAQPPKGPANPNTRYGAGTTATGAVDASRLPGLLKNDTGKLAVKIQAKVLDVCPKKGCWMKLQVNDSTTAFVKMKNYGFFVPLDIKGKTIVLDGEAYQHVTSVAEQRHYAEDAKKTQAEIDAITEPLKEYRYTASGILVLQ